jgi:hypothetical protein
LKGALQLASRYEDKKCSLDFSAPLSRDRVLFGCDRGYTRSASSVASAVTVTDLRGNAQILEEARFTPAEIEDLGEGRVVTAAV